MSKNNRAVEAHAPKKRPARVRMGQGARLEVAAHLKRDGYFQYWFIDKPGQLEQAEKAWYEYVKDDSGKRLSVSAGEGLTHYLMEIPQNLRDEDMAAQEALNVGQEKASASVKHEKKEYSPEGTESSLAKS